MMNARTKRASGAALWALATPVVGVPLMVALLALTTATRPVDPRGALDGVQPAAEQTVGSGQLCVDRSSDA